MISSLATAASDAEVTASAVTELRGALAAARTDAKASSRQHDADQQQLQQLQNELRSTTDAASLASAEAETASTEYSNTIAQLGQDLQALQSNAEGSHRPCDADQQQLQQLQTELDSTQEAARMQSEEAEAAASDYKSTIAELHQELVALQSLQEGPSNGSVTGDVARPSGTAVPMPHSMSASPAQVPLQNQLLIKFVCVQICCYIISSWSSILVCNVSSVQEPKALEVTGRT